MQRLCLKLIKFDYSLCLLRAKKEAPQATQVQFCCWPTSPLPLGFSYKCLMI